ncbi:toxin-antitoxin system HicB family antitoxin [Streptomyces sp. B6B3]|uniref:toxin-antitoxin system HicB family antitoxin n=1 Tax=Streptomyces sp. B6B3 TaxID=3153570 RepID=UPI00325F4126
MDLTPYVDNLRHALAVAAEASGEDARVLAERLTGPLDSAARLALLNVLSDAMGEVTRELAPGSVDVRLRGLDPDFVVTPPPSGEPGRADEGPVGPFPPSPPGPPAPPAPPGPPAVPDLDDGGTSRINLRLPAQLKLRAEEAAARDGLSLNAWLVRAVAAAVDPGGAAGRQDWDPEARQRGRRSGRQSFTGWVR